MWLADDDPASLRVLELRLAHAGYRVQGMTGGLEMLARLESHLRFSELAHGGFEGSSDVVESSLSDSSLALVKRHPSSLPALFTPEASVGRRAEVGFFEPDPQQAAHLKSTLEALGYGVKIYSRPPSPLETPHPDLLLLDLGGLHHPGIATCRAFKERSSTRDLPIIIMAPQDSGREAKLLAWDTGADEYFEKPLERMELGVRARALLKRKLLQDQLSSSFDDLSQRASEDPLTGLANRGTFDRTLEREFARAQAKGCLLSLLLLDVDHFKHFNDQNGHPVGDTLLRDLCNLLSSEARRRDTVARYGGEEFAFILPDASELEGLQVIERLQSRIRQTRFVGGEGQPGGKLTVSIGLAALPFKGVTEPIQLLKKADQALYAAKNRGRNCSVSSSELNGVD